MLSDLMENYFQAPKVARKSEPGCPIAPKEEGWKIVTDPRRLHRTLSFPSNVSYFDFIRDLINYEQKTNHYGKLVLDYPNITIEVYTHDLNDITEMDLEYARYVDQVHHDVCQYKSEFKNDDVSRFF
jgi:pterin-4a-carbinolamine dehydratase